MFSLRVFATAMLVSLWTGGFLFYAAVVVPVGSAMIGKTSQGFITSQVTIWLNLFSCLIAVTMLIDLRRRSHLRRFAATFLFACAIPVLWTLHVILTSQMETSTQSIASPESFYQIHRAYLLISTLQWGTAVYWILTLGKEISALRLP